MTYQDYKDLQQADVFIRRAEPVAQKYVFEVRQTQPVVIRTFDPYREGHEGHTLRETPSGFICDCPCHKKYRDCKHVQAVVLIYLTAGSLDAMVQRMMTDERDYLRSLDAPAAVPHSYTSEEW